MRVSPADLQAVQRAGMPARSSVFGPVSFMLADLPSDGTAGLVEGPRLTETPPGTVTVGGRVAPFRRPGTIDVEGAVMGQWLFMRATLGSRSGYTSGWCDVPHWGIVLDGETAIEYEEETELAARGDPYFAPPGHRFVSPDGATIADYTPMAALDGARVSRWRRAAVARAPSPGEPPTAVAPAPAG